MNGKHGSMCSPGKTLAVEYGRPAHAEIIEAHKAGRLPDDHPQVIKAYVKLPHLRSQPRVIPPRPGMQAYVPADQSRKQPIPPAHPPPASMMQPPTMPPWRAPRELPPPPPPPPSQHKVAKPVLQRVGKRPTATKAIVPTNPG